VLNKIKRLNVKKEYISVSKFIKDHFNHKVSPFQFKNFIFDMLEELKNIDGVDEDDLVLKMPKGAKHETIVSVIFIPLLAKWIIRKKINLVDKDTTINEVLDILLFSNEKYIVRILNEEKVR